MHIPGAFSPEDTAAIVADYRELSRRRQRMGVLVDMRSYDAAASTAPARKRSAAIFQEATGALRPTMVCEARVVSGAVLRYVLTAFDWMTGTPWPRANFSTTAEAEEWVRRHLADDAMRFPDASPTAP